MEVPRSTMEINGVSVELTTSVDDCKNVACTSEANHPLEEVKMLSSSTGVDTIGISVWITIGISKGKREKTRYSLLWLGHARVDGIFLSPTSMTGARKE